MMVLTSGRPEAELFSGEANTLAICQTGFVSKFLSDGSLSFSTYMGGSAASSSAIAVDSAGEAYVTGSVSSNDLPTTSGSFEPTFPGNASGYVEKLNASGSALVYSTYFGSSGTPTNQTFTAGAGIAVDSSGSAYLVGNTLGIPTQNPIQASYVGGGSIVLITATHSLSLQYCDSRLPG